MFDSLNYHVRCKKCGHLLEELQTKDLEQTLQIYEYNDELPKILETLHNGDVPTDQLRYIKANTDCSACDLWYEFKIKIVKKKNRFFLGKIQEIKTSKYS